MEYIQVNGGICAPKGFRASGIHAGIRKNHDKKDLALIVSDVTATAAAMYTQNKVFGAPIIVTKRNLEDGTARAVICNSGNANTCNADGLEKAEEMCSLTAKALGLQNSDIIVASTGVIGLPFLIEPIATGLKPLTALLSTDGGNDAAQAIMTTDTHPKEFAIEFQLSGKPCRIAAIAKGSGMIHPNMATMLSFITSDAAIDRDLLHKALKAAVDVSYNMVSVDGDTSTNDMVVILANGMAENVKISEENDDYRIFAEALRIVAVHMAKEIAGDGEGASKLLECAVTHAPDQELAKKIAKSIITSSLTKAAMFGADANWGRVLCAIGYTEGDFRVDTINVDFVSDKGCLPVCRNGMGLDFSEDMAKVILLEPEVQILVDMGQGEAEATAWGCDLTYEYVRINGDYRT